jgi:3-oxoacyl-[acyl-carrier-protein] synthase-3
MTDIRIGITGTGGFLPSNVVSNEQLARRLDTSAEAIFRVTGIRTRRLCNEQESLCIMAAVAGLNAVEDAGLTPTDIDAVYCAVNINGEFTVPATGNVVQHLMGMPAATCADGETKFSPACDLVGGCCGPIFALEAALGKILSTRHLDRDRNPKVLVIGGDCASDFVNWNDRETAMVFSDGAGAFVVEDLDAAERRSVVTLDDDEPSGILAIHLASDGMKADTICQLSPTGSRGPTTRPSDELPPRREFLRMKGAEVYRNAVRRLGSSLATALEQAGLRMDDIDLFVPHQANLEILRKVFRDRIPADVDTEESKVYTRGIVHEGNCSAGTTPIALDNLNRTGRLQPGMTLAMPMFGAGMSWGTAIFRWHKPRRDRLDWETFETRQQQENAARVESLHPRLLAMLEKMQTPLTLR